MENYALMNFCACNTHKVRTTHFMILTFEIRIIAYFVSPAQKMTFSKLFDCQVGVGYSDRSPAFVKRKLVFFCFVCLFFVCLFF